MAKIVKNNLERFLKICFIFLIVTGWIFSGWPQILQNPSVPPEIEQARAATINVSPNAKHANDTTGDELSGITADDAAAGDYGISKVTTTDNVYTVDKDLVMQIDTFDVSSIPDGDVITAAVLHLQWGAEGGYNGTNPVKYNNGGGLTTTGIIPSDTGAWSADETFDLHNAGVDSKSELGAVDIEFTNNDLASPSDAINFDYVWITVTHDTPPTGLFNSAAQKTDGTGKVDISIEVDDPNDDDCKALIEYTSDGTCSSGWVTTPNVTLVGPATASYNDSGGAPDINNSAAYQVGSGSTTRIDTSSGSNTVQFDWDSATDAPSGNSTYCLRLTVNDDAVNQTTSATQTLTIDNVNPDTPGNLTDGGKTATTITLTFGSVSSDTNEPNVDAYKIFYKEGASGVTEANTEHHDSDLDSYNYNSTATTTVTGLEASTQYFFNIWAYDTFGNKASAAEVSITTNAHTPAIGNIDSTYKYAWGENIGWTNWRPYYGGVTVYSECLTGYTWNENVGWIKIGDNSSNCTDNDCCQNGTSKGYENDSNSVDDDGDGEVDDWGVNNNGSGNLSGYAWGENIGWLNFDDTSVNDYSQVVIDGSGNFTNYAWGENVGWVNMSCDNNSYCGTVLYRVKTSWTGGNTAPSFSAGPSDGGSSGTSPTNVGSNVSFSGTATDSSDSWKLLLCSTSTAPTASTSTPACAGGSGNLWCVDDTWRASTVESSCTYTATSTAESHDWWAFACDNNASPECSSGSQGTPDGGTDSPFKVNHRPSFTALNISWALNETNCNALSGWDWLNGACWSDSIMDYVSWNKGTGDDTDDPGAYTCNSGGTLKSRMEAAVVGHWSEICTVINGVTITSDYDGHGDGGHDGDETISALAISDCVDGTRDLCTGDPCLGSNGTEINTALNTWATAANSKSSLSQTNTTCTNASYCPEGNYNIGVNEYNTACTEAGGTWDENTSTLAPSTNYSWGAACGISSGNNWGTNARILGLNSCSYTAGYGTSLTSSLRSFRVVVRP